MNEVLETINYRGFEIEILHDNHYESPREWSNLGTMICFHKRYDLGDKHNIHQNDFNSWNEINNYLITEHDAYIILPLYLYDHSNLRMKVGSFQGLLPQGHAEFDSGQIGFIYVSEGTIEKEYGTNNSRTDKEIAKYLQKEVDIYDDYLSGSVYGYNIESIDESCYGFYGYDHEKSGLLEGAKEIIDFHIQETTHKHCQQVKQWIKNKLPLIYRKPLNLERS